MAAATRLASDLRKIQLNPHHGVTAEPVTPGDLFLWHGIVIGPQDTAYRNGIFKIELKFSLNYPVVPPEVRFLSEMFHPNVNSNGDICIDILRRDKWQPIYDVAAILACLASLLQEPNPNSSINSEAANIYKSNLPEFENRCQQVALLSQNNV